MASIHDKDTFERVKNLVNFYYFKFVLKEPFNDVFNDLVYSLMKSKYLERYDGSRPIHNYLSGFVYNHFCKVYKKESYVVSRAESLDQELFLDSDTTLGELIEVESYQDSDSKLEMENIVKILDSHFFYSTFVSFDKNLRFEGIFDASERNNFDDSHFVLPRSHSVVFTLLFKGLSQTDIKQVLRVSKSWVSKTVTAISEVPEMRDLAVSCGYRL